MCLSEHLSEHLGVHVSIDSKSQWVMPWHSCLWCKRVLTFPGAACRVKAHPDGFPAISSHHHPKQRRPFFLYARCFSPVTAFSGSGTKWKLVKNRHFREGNSTRLRKITNTIARCLVWQDGINTRPSTQHSVQRWWLSSRFSAAVKPCSLPDSSIALPLVVHGERTLLSLDSDKYC